MPSDLDKYLSMKDALIQNEKDNWVTDYKSITKERFNIELAFCLMTPMSKAKAANAVLLEVDNNWKKITPEILAKYGIRFKNNKYENIQRIDAYELYDLYISDVSNFYMRNILNQEVRGFGLKEASHFCRNCGRGDQLAILDRHIFSCIKDRIDNKWDKSELLSLDKNYLVVENSIVNYAQSLSIPEKYLDMIWWSEKSGHLFK